MNFTRIIRRSRRGKYWGPTLYCERCRKHAPHLYEFASPYTARTIALCRKCMKSTAALDDNLTDPDTLKGTST
jgi:hypothetical protein